MKSRPADSRRRAKTAVSWGRPTAGTRSPKLSGMATSLVALARWRWRGARRGRQASGRPVLLEVQQAIDPQVRADSPGAARGALGLGQGAPGRAFDPRGVLDLAEAEARGRREPAPHEAALRGPIAGDLRLQLGERGRKDAWHRRQRRQGPLPGTRLRCLPP